jgi:RNA polymerase sigma-70 factor, ECF subfamily
MNETRQSLLLRAQTGETNAWKDLTDLYRPLILGWLHRQGVPARDREDLSQEVLLSVVQHLPGFQHSGHRGAFRSWLRTIVCRRTADYWRALDAGAQAPGGSGATAAL